MAEDHRVVPHDEWLEERRALLAKEKEFTRLRDEIGRQQRALPWEPVEKEYVFDGPDGRESLAELFDGRSQLIVYPTYSTYARGIDMLNAAYNYIDLVPKGRDEEGRAPQFWVRRHDEYDR